MPMNGPRNMQENSNTNKRWTNMLNITKNEVAQWNIRLNHVLAGDTIWIS